MLEELRLIRAPRQHELRDLSMVQGWAPRRDRLDPNLSTGYPGGDSGRSTGTFDPLAEGGAGE